MKNYIDAILAVFYYFCAPEKRDNIFNKHVDKSAETSYDDKRDFLH